MKEWYIKSFSTLLLFSLAIELVIYAINNGVSQDIIIALILSILK
jgi:hypothetical protein